MCQAVPTHKSGFVAKPSVVNYHNAISRLLHKVHLLDFLKCNCALCDLIFCNACCIGGPRSHTVWSAKHVINLPLPSNLTTENVNLMITLSL